MMRMRTKTTELTSMKSTFNGKYAGENELEVRPGGMLVQKRDPDNAPTRIPPPTIRVRVKYGSIYHEIIISSTATFGELKKLLSGPTGLHHEDQKIIFRDKERASRTFLDVAGVKDKSKLVLLDDPISREKRLIETRKNAKIVKFAKLISDIGLEVDRLGGQVAAVESVISKGGKVADKTMSDLTALLMNYVLNLDEIKVAGDLYQQKQIQAKKVRKHVEELDVLKLKNTQSPPRVNPENGCGANHLSRHQSRQSVGKFEPIESVAAQQQRVLSKNTLGEVVVTTQWETFDSLQTNFLAPPSTSTTGGTIQHNFDWDLLLK